MYPRGAKVHTQEGECPRTMCHTGLGLTAPALLFCTLLNLKFRVKSPLLKSCAVLFSSCDRHSASLLHVPGWRRFTCLWGCMMRLTGYLLLSKGREVRPPLQQAGVLNHPPAPSPHWVVGDQLGAYIKVCQVTDPLDLWAWCR